MTDFARGEHGKWGKMEMLRQTTAAAAVDQTFRSIILFAAALLGTGLPFAAPPVLAQQTAVFSEGLWVARAGAIAFAAPDEKSDLIYDLPPGTIISAKDVGAGWLRVDAIGRFQTPIKAFRSREKDEADIPFQGFVHVSKVERFYNDVPLDSSVVQPVEQYLGKFDIIDRRQHIVKFTDAPARSVASLAVKKGTCSAVFVGNVSTLVSAGHCFKDNGSTVPVSINWGPAGHDVIEGQVKYEDDGNDWAVIRLARAPVLPVQPLAFHDGSSLAGMRRISVLLIGYAGDLHYASKSRFGYTTPVAAACQVDLTKGSGAARWGLELGLDNCATTYGVSGGPVLVWNGKTSRYDVLALLVDGSTVVYGGTTFDGQFIPERPEARADYRQLAEQNARRIGRTPSPQDVARWFTKDMSSTDEADVPGFAAFKTLNVERSAPIAKAYLFGDMVQASTSQNAGAAPATRQSADYIAMSKGWSSAKGSEQFIDADRTKDFHPGFEIWRDLRRLCSEICKPEWLTGIQLRQTYGEMVDPSTLAGQPASHAVIEATKLPSTLTQNVERELHLKPGENGGYSLLIAGGDAFLLPKNDGLPKWIIRDLMRIRGMRSLGIVNPGVAGCEIASVGEDEPKSWSDEPNDLVSNYAELTPKQITGGTAISARQAYCMLRTGSAKPLVISVIEEPFGIPSAVKLPWSAVGGNLADGVQGKLQDTLSKTLSSASDRPILVYCHHDHCMLSYNVSRRLIKLGFSKVFWIRDGLQGWIEGGFPLAPVARVAGGVQAADVGRALDAETSPDWSSRTAINGRVRFEFPATSRRQYANLGIGADFTMSEAFSFTYGDISMEISAVVVPNTPSGQKFREVLLKRFEGKSVANSQGAACRRIVTSGEAAEQIERECSYGQVLVQQKLVVRNKNKQAVEVGRRFWESVAIANES